MKRPAIGLPELLVAVARPHTLSVVRESLTRAVEGRFPVPPTTMGFPPTLPVTAGLAIAVDEPGYVLPRGLHPLLRLLFRIYALCRW
jgi:hypothetical protein